MRSFDEQTRAGSVVFDDGTELPFDAAAVAAGGVRFLRQGQRVRVRVAGERGAGHVVFVTILTLPDPR